MLNDGETITCVFTNDQELFKLEGYVWEDSDEDGIYDEDESPLAGWDVQTTNGSKEYATTSAPDGYYYFFVPAGTWTISETLQSNWDQTFPVEADDFVHVVTVPQYYVEEVTFLENVFNFFVPTVYAQAPYPTVYGDYNFGNKPEPRRSGGGGGGGRRVTNDDPETPVPQVLGEATSIMPVGAPNTGKGGSAPLRATIPTIVGIATVGAALRRTK